MTPKERQELLERIVGRIVDVTDLTEDYVEDTDTGLVDNVPATGRYRRYRTNREWLKE